MMENNEFQRMRAIKIDPDKCSVEIIEVGSEEVAGVLRSELIETIDFEGAHCLVIDDGNRTTDHPTRFRFANGPVHRPFFGPVLILGIANGNWGSATLEPGAVSARIIWEEWDRRELRYAAPALSRN